MGTKQTAGATIFLFYLCVSIVVGNSTWRRSTWPGHWPNLIGADQPLPILLSSKEHRYRNQCSSALSSLSVSHQSSVLAQFRFTSVFKWELVTPNKAGYKFSIWSPSSPFFFQWRQRQTSGSPSSSVDAVVNLLFGTQLTKQKVFFVIILLLDFVFHRNHHFFTEAFNDDPLVIDKQMEEC